MNYVNPAYERDAIRSGRGVPRRTGLPGARAAARAALRRRQTKTRLPLAIPSPSATQGGAGGGVWCALSGAFTLFPRFSMRWIENALSELRSAASRLVPPPIQQPDKDCRGVFTRDDLRVSLHGPFSCGHHEVLIERCGVGENWFPVGVLTDAEILPMIGLLEQAEDHFWPPNMLSTVHVGGKHYFVDEQRKQLRNVENPGDCVDFE